MDHLRSKDPFLNPGERYVFVASLPTFTQQGIKGKLFCSPVIRRDMAQNLPNFFRFTPETFHKPDVKRSFILSAKRFI